MNNSNFGRFLATVAERDIDLLLMEEFHVNSDFVDWFALQVGIVEPSFDGAWHSVSDTDGETDLLLRVVCGDHRIGVLIENKVAAPEQDEQSRRYHLRGIRSREAGYFEEYRTVMSAPSRYLDTLPADTLYEHRISYEAIADWFGQRTDARSQWRSRIMREAIEQGRRGYTMLVNEAHSRFHREYWGHLVARHPQLQMAKPGNKGGKSRWIIMKGVRFPKRVKLHHKLDQRTVEIGFERRSIEEVIAAAGILPDDIVVMQKGKTASLVINVPHVEITRPFGDQIATVEEVLRAAYRLAEYARLLEQGP